MGFHTHTHTLLSTVIEFCTFLTIFNILGQKWVIYTMDQLIEWVKSMGKLCLTTPEVIQGSRVQHLSRPMLPRSELAKISNIN